MRRGKRDSRIARHGPRQDIVVAIVHAAKQQFPADLDP